ncbi:MAG TPA: deoxyribodipyrimidine photolyase, partial [Eubacteriaceae bacterium]|nr:deoxyribodipyrimidine photolyase [Eubacteriaceae bacterium]
MNDTVRVLKDQDIKTKGPVVYWMSRDQRTKDNRALLYAQKIALEYRLPLAVAFFYDENYPFNRAIFRDFMLSGLTQVKKDLQGYCIDMHLFKGKADQLLPAYLKQTRASLLVSDFSPLKTALSWKEQVNRVITIPHHECDGRNIVPCFVASDKKEYAAYTLRPKIHKKLDAYLQEEDELALHPFPLKNDQSIFQNARIDPHSHSLDLDSGEAKAQELFEQFIQSKISGYNRSNDPNADVTSGLSKYLHFGQISSRQMVRTIMEEGIQDNGFIEQLVVRRELADNFCYYESHYDSTESFPEWARKTIALHSQDPRPYLYDAETLEAAQTHDPLWNAAQRQMVFTGYMHGYMRMYWAKKILEWTPNAKEAMDTARYLNDFYLYDGRDPNGYASIAWSIGGVHDRAWQERPVFGKIRTMT